MKQVIVTPKELERLQGYMCAYHIAGLEILGRLYGLLALGYGSNLLPRTKDGNIIFTPDYRPVSDYDSPYANDSIWYNVEDFKESFGDDKSAQDILDCIKPFQPTKIYFDAPKHSEVWWSDDDNEELRGDRRSISPTTYFEELFDNWIRLCQPSDNTSDFKLLPEIHENYTRWSHPEVTDPTDISRLSRKIWANSVKKKDKKTGKLQTRSQYFKTCMKDKGLTPCSQTQEDGRLKQGYYLILPKKPEGVDMFH